MKESWQLESSTVPKVDVKSITVSRKAAPSEIAMSSGPFASCYVSKRQS